MTEDRLSRDKVDSRQEGLFHCCILPNSAKVLSSADIPNSVPILLIPIEPLEKPTLAINLSSATAAIHRVFVCPTRKSGMFCGETGLLLRQERVLSCFELGVQLLSLYSCTSSWTGQYPTLGLAHYGSDHESLDPGKSAVNKSVTCS